MSGFSFVISGILRFDNVVPALNAGAPTAATASAGPLRITSVLSEAIATALSVPSWYASVSVSDDFRAAFSSRRLGAAGAPGVTYRANFSVGAPSLSVVPAMRARVMTPAFSTTVQAALMSDPSTATFFCRSHGRNRRSSRHFDSVFDSIFDFVALNFSASSARSRWCSNFLGDGRRLGRLGT